MTVATRIVPRKRQRRGPSFEAGLGRAIGSNQPPATEEVAAPGILQRLVAAAKPESSADATLQLGLGVLTVALWGITGSLFVGLMAPGLVLTYVALMAYLRPRGAA